MNKQEKIDFKKSALHHFTLPGIFYAASKTNWIRNDLDFIQDLKNQETFKHLRTLIEHQTLDQQTINVSILLMEVIFLTEKYLDYLKQEK